MNHFSTHIIEIALTTNVEQRSREIAECKGKGIVNRPLRGQESVTEARETTTRRRIRFEHDEWFVVLLR